MREDHTYICITHAYTFVSDQDSIFPFFQTRVSKPCVKDRVCQTFTYYKTNMIIVKKYAQ